MTRLISYSLLALLLLATPASAEAIRQVFLPANDLVYDSATHRIYASVPANDNSPGGITSLDPETGQIGPTVPIDGKPERLAIADQGRYLYVGLDDAGAVRPFDTVTGTAGQPFSLGTGTGPNLAEEMVVAPGHPETLAVARYTRYIDPRSEGVAIYDNGIPRPKATAHRLNAANSIAFGATAARLYGFANETDEFHFYRWRVDESGIADGDILSLVSGFSTRILFDSGRLYATSGGVYDPEAGTLLGTLPPGEVRPDSARGRVYVLQGTGYNALLLTCDANTFRQLGAIRFAGVSGTVGSLIHWGTDGVAFRSGDGRIFLIHTDQLAPQRTDLSLALSAPAVRVGGTVTGTLTLLTPAPPGGLSVTLASSSPGIVRHPASVTVPGGATQAFFSLIGEPVTTATTVTITAFSAGGTASAPLQVFPDTSPSGNLLVNGSFEQPDVSSGLFDSGVTYGPEPVPEITTQYAGVSIPGWRITHGDIKLVQRRWRAIDGHQSLDLEGAGEGRIEQSFPTEPGREYAFSGYMSQHPLIGAGLADVYLNGKFFVQMQHVTVAMDWSFFILRFQATEPITTLTISDVTARSPIGGLVLDGLSVTPAGTPLTPAPKARPAPPTGLTARPAGRAIVLEWEDNSGDNAGVVILRRPATSDSSARIATVGPNVTRFVDQDVEPGVTYIYRVQLADERGFAVGFGDAKARLEQPPTSGEPLLVSGSIGVSQVDPSTGTRTDFVAPYASHGLTGGAGIAIGPDGNLYIATGASKVVRWDLRTGTYLGTFVLSGDGGLGEPRGIAFGPDGNLYVCSSGNNQILRYDGRTGGFIDAFVPAGLGGLDQPYDLKFGPDGNLYVASSRSDSILRYQAVTGAFLGAFVPPGGGGLGIPRGLTFGPDGDLYVTNAGSSSVQRYDGRTGSPKGVFVAPGSGGLQGPVGLAFGPDRNLYVASSFTSRVLRYDGRTGAFLNVFIVGQLQMPQESFGWLLFPPAPTGPDLLVNAPAAPTGLTASAVARDRVRLAWTDPPAPRVPGPGETAVAVWRKGGGADWARVGALAAHTTSFTDTGLTPGTTYTYRVRAINGAANVASDWSNEVTVMTPAGA